jgi:hypothetical protein
MTSSVASSLPASSTSSDPQLASAAQATLDSIRQRELALLEAMKELQNEK